MRRGLFRSAAVVASVVWFTRTLGCDPSTAAAVLRDTDGDGLSDTDERSIHHTSPTMADTDGDGFSDYDEIVTKAFDSQSAPLRFNPLVADVPMLEVEIASIPWLTLHLTDINGETRTIEVDQTISNTWGEAVSNTQSVTQGFEESLTDAFRRAVTTTEEESLNVLRRDAGATTSTPAPDAGVPEPTDDSNGGDPVLASITNGVANLNERTTTFGQARSTEVTFSFTAEQSREYTEAFTRADSYSQTHEIQASGGSLEVMAFIRNRGNLAFQVTNLFVAASVVGDDGAELPVANLELSSTLSNFQAFSMSPGQEIGPVTFFNDDITLEQSALMLRDVRTIRLRIGAFELKNENSRPYNFDVPTIRGRTAAVNIDYGDLHPPEWYMVATNLDPARAGLNVYRAMTEVLRIPFECEPATGRVSVRGVGASDGDDGRWCIFHRHRADGEDKSIPYCSDEPSFDCNLIELRAGDLVRLSWMPY